MPDDDNERSECKRARMEGVVGVEGNSSVGVGMSVAGAGGNEMDMTTTQRRIPSSTGRCRLLVLHGRVRRVTLCWCGLLMGMEACLVTPERPLRRARGAVGVEATMDCGP